MRIGVAATPDIAIPTLNWLYESEHEIALVISKPDRLSGRGRKIKHTAVSTWAIEKSLPLLRPESPLELDGAINNLDLVLTIGYGVLLPMSILKLPRHGFLNLHFSLLPAYRGAAPVQRAIENGEVESGVTVFALDKGMDTGPIYSYAKIEIENGWRAQELILALAEMGPSVVGEAFAAIEKGVAPTPQVGISSVAPKISKQEAKVDWNQSAGTVLRRIRAFYPQPIAWCEFRDGVLKITSATLSQLSLAPGELMISENRVVVGCGDDCAIALVRVIPAGKREMDAMDWARGARLNKGEQSG